MRRALVAICAGPLLTLSALSFGSGEAAAKSREAREIAAARADGCFEANTKRRSLGAWTEVRAEVRCRSGAYGHWVVMVPKVAKAKRRDTSGRQTKDRKAEPVSLKCVASPDPRGRGAKAKQPPTVSPKCWPAKTDRSAPSKRVGH